MGVDVTHNQVKSDQQGMSTRFQATLVNLNPSSEPMPRRFSLFEGIFLSKKVKTTLATDLASSPSKSITSKM